MDELINHLMHNPENTNPNVIRDMLKNSNTNEPNVQIIEVIDAQKNNKYFMIFDELDSLFIPVYFIVKNIYGFIDDNEYSGSYMGNSFYFEKMEGEFNLYNFDSASTIKSINDISSLVQNFESVEIFVPNKECSVMTTTPPGGGGMAIFINEEEFYDNFTSIGTV